MKNFIYWLASVCIVTLVFGTIYAAMQQGIRLSANYPQAQIAEDLAASLNQEDVPANIDRPKVNVADSLAPFVIIYDASGKVVSSSAELDGKTPDLPSGVLAESARHENRITWQPSTGVRIAAVIVKGKNNYVLAGRNLRDVEKLESHIMLLTALGWAISIAILWVSMLLAIAIRKK